MRGDFTLFSEFAVTSVLGCQINDNATWLHELNHLLGDELWCWLAWNEGCCNDDVYLLALLCEKFHLCFMELFTHLLCVSSDTGAAFTEAFDLQELCAQ